MSVINLTSENQQEMLNSDKPVLIDFFASWCGPCKMLSPVVDEIASELDGEITVLKCDIDQNSALAQRFSVMSVPTLVLLRHGIEIKRLVGVRPKDEIIHSIREIQTSLN